jgi:hypothetical protein
MITSMRKLKISVLMLAATVGVLVAVGVTQAAILGHATAKHPKTAAHKKATKKVHGLKAPSLLAPANGVHAQQFPALTWSAVSGAIDYEYQVAADPRFHSLVAVSAGIGKGIPITHNLAATLEKPVTDGTYYWRVRGVSAAKRPGPWSVTRTVVKAWNQAPQLLGPVEDTEIQWPSMPLILSWSPVPYATEYIVTIATDPGLSHIVLGSTISPQKTWATTFAVPGSVQAGQTYYWAITPLDGLGHRGQISQTRSFTLHWPSTMATSVTPLNAQSGEAEFNWTPELGWTSVTGAARYEVEVSSAENYPVGSIWSDDTTIGTVSYSPPEPLNNNEYYWRVRAIDANGNAGQWNEGPRFKKAFDNATPTIPNLTMSDVNGNPLAPGIETETPIVTWGPVPGAGSYEVQLAPFKEGSCNWSSVATYYTATLAWTPLAPGHKIGQENWPGPQTGSNLKAGSAYCVQVAARSDKDKFQNQIESAPTQLGGAGQPAFTFPGVENTSGPSVPLTPSSAYLLPSNLSAAPHHVCTPWVEEQERPACPRTPLFTWQPVAGASSYYVVIARDKNFTNIVDIGSTQVTAYAPQIANEEPLNDETTEYYWAVWPVNSKGEIGSDVRENSPQRFDKSSTPPQPTSAREEGAAIAFKWTPAEGAVNYTLETATDPTFANIIEEKTTDSTAYTSSATYPAYGTLYWRVRANDAAKVHEGLSWSATQSFTRTLPLTSPLGTTPSESEQIPVLSWQPVLGAVGYGIHIEQPGGTTKNFTTESTAFTATEWDGPGIWRWQVQALFPTSNSSTVSGGYFAPQSLAHTVAQPRGATGVKSGARIVISWDPQAYAKEYEVAISTNETFSTTIESHKVTQTSWAPSKVDLTKPANKGTLYWRVAAVDNKGNVGPYATGRFVPPKPKCVVKKVKKGKKTVKKCVPPKHKPAKKKAKKLR